MTQRLDVDSENLASGLSVRLARNPADIAAAQALRFRVFYEELDAVADSASLQTRHDIDPFDAVCDHLMVIKHNPTAAESGLAVDDGELVGTYRLLRQDIAKNNFGFYAQSEFDIERLLARHAHLTFLELGRSCVLQPYRGRAVIELLWQGIWNYMRRYQLDVMMGCASLEGANAQTHAATLSFLNQHARPPEDWRVSAHEHLRAPVTCDPAISLNQKQALRALPPLIKGYLRLGCYIGEDAVEDRQFNTTDVLILLPKSAINPRYFNHFGRPN
jgi:L-ornithine Nalpha-acyltransferase